ncbi:MAG: hypothetical protein LW850_29495 [Planctomycetaceae bacterium]|nr:hypothetical protein [Planctomycetaceae bacterium]
MKSARLIGTFGIFGYLGNVHRSIGDSLSKLRARLLEKLSEGREIKQISAASSW